MCPVSVASQKKDSVGGYQINSLSGDERTNSFYQHGLGIMLLLVAVKRKVLLK